jgi:hypothetical protein
MGVLLDIYVEYFVRVIIGFFKRWNARLWNIVTAEVTDTDYRHSGIGCAVADVSYRYEIDGQVYTGTNSVPFISDGSAKDYVEHYSPKSQLLIRVRPGYPGVSVVRETDLYRVEHGFRLETK